MNFWTDNALFSAILTVGIVVLTFFPIVAFDAWIENRRYESFKRGERKHYYIHLDGRVEVHPDKLMEHLRGRNLL